MLWFLKTLRGKLPKEAFPIVRQNWMLTYVYLMKLYVIISGSLAQIGGAQLHIKSKKEYLEKHGYHVIIFHSSIGKSVFDCLNEYENCNLKEFALPAFYFTKKCCNRILSYMQKITSNYKYENCIIESHSIALSTWGELFAKRIGAKHFIFNITELPYSIPCLRSYLLFKFNRKELAFIKKEAIYTIFPNIVLPENHIVNLCAYNVDKSIDDVKNPFEDVLSNMQSKYIIGIVGRLEKPYVLGTLNQIRSFILEFLKGQKITLVYVGGETDGGERIKRMITDYFASLSNVNTFFTGFIYPIPFGLVEKFDVCIANAGTARRLRALGRFVISIDAHDNEPIGLLGVTTNNTFYRDSSDSAVQLKALLKDILLDRVYAAPQKIVYDSDISKIGEHLDFIAASSKLVTYYDIFDINYPMIVRLKRYFISLFGLKCYMKLGYKRHCISK